MRKKRQEEKDTIEIQEDTRIGDYILEKGDKIEVLDSDESKSIVEEVDKDDIVDVLSDLGFSIKRIVRAFEFMEEIYNVYDKPLRIGPREVASEISEYQDEYGSPLKSNSWVSYIFNNIAFTILINQEDDDLKDKLKDMDDRETQNFLSQVRGAKTPEDITEVLKNW